jgi:hypothetical protein
LVRTTSRIAFEHQQLKARELVFELLILGGLFGQRGLELLTGAFLLSLPLGHRRAAGHQAPRNDQQAQGRDRGSSTIM